MNALDSAGGKINQNNILIDGFHRLKAHQLLDVEEIEAKMVETKSEFELKKLSYQLNSNHGLQLSNEEKIIRIAGVEEVWNFYSVCAVGLFQVLEPREYYKQKWYNSLYG